MGGISGKKLVFHIRDAGFSVVINELLEIRDPVDTPLDTSQAEQESFRLGHVAFRGRQIELVDLAALMGIGSPSSIVSSAYLVLAGEIDPWAVAVSRTDGVFNDSEFTSLEAPEVLLPRRQGLFHWLDLWRDELLVQWQPARFYCRTGWDAVEDCLA